MKKILIGYVTKTNTTKEYADYIKKELESADVKVDTLPMAQVNNLKNYDNVILGAPINGMMWVPEAFNFVKENADFLNCVPTAFFFVSYIYENGRPMWNKAIDNSMQKVTSVVKPVITSKFGGRIEKRFPKLFAWVFGIKKELPLNLVNFEAVDKFLVEIKEKFRL